MQAVAIRRGETAPTVIETEKPAPAPGEALVRVLRVGVDGTDYEVIEGDHGGYPDGDDHLILGHEAVGVVEEVNADDGQVAETYGREGPALDEGDVVVPTVRRPPEDGPNEYFTRGEPDMAPPEDTLECGIAGAHGFAAEYITVPLPCLIEVPETLAEYGFLVEPVSVSEKAFEHAYASRDAFDWEPEAGLVLGNGCLGLLTLAMLDQRGFERTYCLGRRDRPDPTIDIMEERGAEYIDSRLTPVDEIPEIHGGMDFIYEATGYAKHPYRAIDALAPNGVAALLGIPGEWEFEIDGGSLHEEFVMHNKALVGSVNSGVKHFEAATETLAAMDEWFLNDLVSGVYGTDEIMKAFPDLEASPYGEEKTIKTALEIDTL
jgi:threonine dehydrogenase-like Zn-dependent dehydrogenase